MNPTLRDPADFRTLRELEWKIRELQSVVKIWKPVFADRFSSDLRVDLRRLDGLLCVIGTFATRLPGHGREFHEQIKRIRNAGTNTEKAEEIDRLAEMAEELERSELAKKLKLAEEPSTPPPSWTEFMVKELPPPTPFPPPTAKPRLLQEPKQSGDTQPNVGGTQSCVASDERGILGAAKQGQASRVRRPIAHRLTPGQRRVVALLQERWPEFVPPWEVEKAHGGSAKASTIVCDLRNRRKILVQSAKQARAAGEDLPQAKGYRLKPA